MTKAPFLHELTEFKDLLEITARDQNIQDPSLIEKDYWIMHCLWGLKALGFEFHLKGGTSLSKGFCCIHRFSEDIDIKIEPDPLRCGFEVYSGKNHDKDKHKESRQKYFDWISHQLRGNVPGIVEVLRDHAFDDTEKARNGGIRLHYEPQFGKIPGLKEGILLEVGFDRTAPNLPLDISSWALDRALEARVAVTDTRAIGIHCYEPKFTFVEKLQAVVRKFRQYKEGRAKKASLPANFIRHYYDLYQLIDLVEVQGFIGTSDYEDFKKERFGSDDRKISNSEAFRLSDNADRRLFESAYSRSSGLYYKGRPSLEEILERIRQDLDRL